jgi:hypothetical protein
MERNLGPEIAIGLVVEIAITMALDAWGRWVAQRRGNGRYWRFVRWTPWMSTGTLAIGTLVGVVSLMRALAAVEKGDASDKASRLSQGISDAMNRSAFFMVLGYALLLLGVVSFIVGSLQARVGGEDRPT